MFRFRLSVILAQSSGISSFQSISQKNMTTKNGTTAGEICPAEQLLKQLSGKWKPQLFRLAMEGPLRFNTLLREMEGVNKQSLSTALHELEEQGLLDKAVIREKPLHIEYRLSEKGTGLVPIFLQLENMLQ